MSKYSAKLHKIEEKLFPMLNRLILTVCNKV